MDNRAGRRHPLPKPQVRDPLLFWCHHWVMPLASQPVRGSITRGWGEMGGRGWHPTRREARDLNSITPRSLPQRPRKQKSRPVPLVYDSKYDIPISRVRRNRLVLLLGACGSTYSYTACTQSPFARLAIGKAESPAGVRSVWYVLGAG